MIRKFIKKGYVHALIFLGTFAWSLTMVKSGLVYRYGMGFWGPNGHDGIWHIAVINSLAKGSWQMPIFAGETLKNYHVGFDLLLAAINKMTSISVVNLYFQIVPPILAVLIGVSVYKFVCQWKKSRIAAFWSTFFVYFSGSFGWIITLIRHEGFGGESLFWAQQSMSTLINPPFALSLVIIFSGLNLYISNTAARSKNESGKGTSGVCAVLSRCGGLKSISLVLLFSILIQIKVYAGILIIISLFIAGIWDYFKNRKLKLIGMSVAVTILSILLLLPTYDFRLGGLILKPFWFLESMVATPDRLYWPKMASAVVNYKLAGNYLKLIPSYGLLFVVFLLGNMGMRIVSLPWFVKKIRNIKSLSDTDVVVLSIVSFAILIPMFFIQRGNSWNSIQFFYYCLVLSSVIAGIVIGEYFEGLMNRERVKCTACNVKFISVITIILGFTIPTAVATLRHYIPSRPPAMISNEELAALEFLKSQPSDAVLTIPFDRELADRAIENPPRPLYLYESTAYVSAMTGKKTFLEDEVNLEITGYDWAGRRKEVLENLDNLDYFLRLGIDYLYVGNLEEFLYKEPWASSMVYQTNGVAVYEVKKI